MALEGRPGEEIVVIDVGGRLDETRREALSRLEHLPAQLWAPEDLQLIAAQPVTGGKGSLPEKRTYGSAYPFADLGQLNKLEAVGETHTAVVSGAYGGFSNVWGAQVMPFTANTFEDWPIGFDELLPHYRAILRNIPYAAEPDDLAELFPLMVDAAPLPPLAPRTMLVLNRYLARRDEIRATGVTIGLARLAMESARCVRCGLCMTGCPYSLIFSSAQVFDRLRAMRRIEYHDGLLAHGLSENSGEVQVHAKRLSDGSGVQFSADRVFVACGAIGTTRLVLGSVAETGAAVKLQEAVQFVVPAISGSAAPDPRQVPSFTLNQFIALISLAADQKTLAQIHFYPYNSAIDDAMPKLLRTAALEPLARKALSRVTVGLGYLPSWLSPPLEMEVGETGTGELPAIRLKQGEWPYGRKPLWSVYRKLLTIAPKLDLWPVLSHAFVSAGAKSYHFGGSFPHSRGVSSRWSTDRLGRLEVWKNVHLVDGSVFPTVPATTFTLTVMSNAHRIASEAVQSGA